MVVLAKMRHENGGTSTSELIKIRYENGRFINEDNDREVQQPVADRGIYFHKTPSGKKESEATIVSEIFEKSKNHFWTDCTVAYNSISIKKENMDRYFDLIALQFFMPHNKGMIGDTSSLRLSEYFGELCVPVNVLPIGNLCFIERFPYDNERDTMKDIEEAKKAQGIEKLAYTFLAKTLESCESERGGIGELTAVQFYRIK